LKPFSGRNFVRNPLKLSHPGHDPEVFDILVTKYVIFDPKNDIKHLLTHLVSHVLGIKNLWNTNFVASVNGNLEIRNPIFRVIVHFTKSWQWTTLGLDQG
jgi:hypothetical protein